MGGRARGRHRGPDPGAEGGEDRARRAAGRGRGVGEAGALARGEAGALARGEAGALARAARAALENLARTLSVEWARYAVTVTMVAPGPGTSDEELAEVVCYLVSVAGDYVSGTRFDLGLVAGGGSVA